MSTVPSYYFSSKKDNSYVNFSIKNINNTPIFEFNTESSLKLNIDNKIYILDVKYNIQFENNKEPIVDIKYKVKEQISENKVESLLLFLSDFKSKINEDLKLIENS